MYDRWGPTNRNSSGCRASPYAILSEMEKFQRNANKGQDPSSPFLTLSPPGSFCLHLLKTHLGWSCFHLLSALWAVITEAAFGSPTCTLHRGRSFCWPVGGTQNIIPRAPCIQINNLGILSLRSKVVWCYNFKSKKKAWRKWGGKARTLAIRAREPCCWLHARCQAFLDQAHRKLGT